MTHNFLHDSELLRTLWPSPLRYIGILGSGQRTRRLLDQVQGSGRSHRDHSLGLVYGPMGLDIGADTPEEIALAVVAEIKAVLTGRLGGMLRTRGGPLHEPSDAADVGARPMEFARASSTERLARRVRWHPCSLENDAALGKATAGLLPVKLPLFSQTTSAGCPA